MGYVVIEHFCDMQDDGHGYNMGDAYPRNGFEVSESRIAELSGIGNAMHRPLIRKVGDRSVMETKEQEVIPAPEPSDIPVAPKKSGGRKKKE